MSRPAMYNRPAKPLYTPVKRRASHTTPPVMDLAEPLIVDKATECHATPPDVAARMVEYLGPQGDFLTLEPSAGTGSLARALLNSGHSRNELTMIERHIGLADRLRSLGPVINRCFLEYAQEAQGKIEFPRVIMNPPFSKVRAHIEAALSLLGCGGHHCATLVALVPVNFEHVEAVTIERLPNTTFATAKVNTKLVRVCR